jgi:folylpolyglutamate synthase/dihydropteroate synthase
MAEELFGLGTRVILTKSSNSRAMPPQAIARATKDLCKRIGLHPVQTSTVAEALRIAQAQNRGQRAIVVTGSLFVAGEARELCL